MHKNWIVVVSNRGAKIFEAQKGSSQLVCLEVLDHPEGRMKVGELETDRPGSTMKGGREKGGANLKMMRGHSDLKQNSDDVFAKKVLDHLNEKRNVHKFEKLLLVTEPAFETHLSKHMPHELEKVIDEVVHKNYYQLQTDEIYSRLKDQIIYSFPV